MSRRFRAGLAGSLTPFEATVPGGVSRETSCPLSEVGRSPEVDEDPTLFGAAEAFRVVEDAARFLTGTPVASRFSAVPSAFLVPDAAAPDGSRGIDVDCLEAAFSLFSALFALSPVSVFESDVVDAVFPATRFEAVDGSAVTPLPEPASLP